MTPAGIKPATDHIVRDGVPALSDARRDPGEG